MIVSQDSTGMTYAVRNGNLHLMIPDKKPIEVDKMEINLTGIDKNDNPVSILILGQTLFDIRLSVLQMLYTLKDEKGTLYIRIMDSKKASLNEQVKAYYKEDITSQIQRDPWSPTGRHEIKILSDSLVTSFVRLNTPFPEIIE